MPPTAFMRTFVASFFVLLMAAIALAAVLAEIALGAAARGAARRPGAGTEAVTPMRPILTVFFALLTVGVTLAGCAPRAPRLARPTRVEAFCGSKEARITSIDSVMTSTDDTILDDHPTDREVRQAVASGFGAIAHFDDLRLALPKSSEALGESDGYARVRAIAVPPAPEGALRRHLYLLVRDHHAQRWITMLAYDVQNVCVEGKRQS